MLIRLTVTIVLYALMFASNASALKRSSRKELAVYGALTAFSAYAGILFVLQKQWPNPVAQSGYDPLFHLCLARQSDHPDVQAVVNRTAGCRGVNR
ncbi:MAG: hypothetical protein K0Q94_6892 [Paenibacillus sp.]|nr:hypothetical protein [Paenibacillus sp.]